MDYLSTLNEPQREAVLNNNGPMMIIAGAGSGKTRVLTYRIAYLVANGVEPFRILSLTFTNKAAKEMRERIEHIIGAEARNLWMGTFHSVFAKILRFEAEKLGYSSNFTIYDTDDSLSVIRAILKEQGLDDKVYKPNSVLSRISSAKNNLISWRQYQVDAELLSQDKEAGKPKIAEIYKEYAMRCFAANSMDFDDLLFNTNVLFKNFPEVVNKYQHKFEYVLIDEFQDTNLSQYAIVRKISAVHQNICVVGDDAQSIYAFRGANIQNILNFEKDYPDLRIVKLEQNYRSTQNIVNAANSVIKHNRHQLPKNVWTDNQDGAPIELMKTLSDSEEGRIIADLIFEEKMQYSLANKEFAILYRTNAQSRAIEEALRRRNIKYKIIGGMSFYQYKEIKDIIAYLRYSVNTNDIEAFKRIINYPRRGIGDTTVEKIINRSIETQLPLWDVLTQAEQHFGKNRFTTAIEDFVTIIKSGQHAIKTKDAYAAASHIAKASGLLKELYEDKTPEGRVRYDNLQELLNAVKAFTDDPEIADKSLEIFLQDIALISNADTKVDDDAVTLMTIHMSKGLEFRNVYIAGMEENLFPSQMMLGSRNDLEEERRLFYVAITRAKHKLTLSYALQRYKYGQLQACEPSRFLDEIDPRYLKTVKPGGFSAEPGALRESASSARSLLNQAASRKPVAASPGFTVPDNFKAALPNELAEGQRVLHPKFGEGTIAQIEKTGTDTRARIQFDHNGEKTLILSFAKLMIIA